MSQPKVGVQPIVYGKRASEDFPTVLRDAKETGYEGVETGNLYARYSPDEVRSMFKANGLVVSGCHSGFGDFEDPEKTESAIAYLKGVGARYLMCSGVGDTKKGLAAYDSAAETFERAGRRCRDEGLLFCYHNHAWEFDAIDGQIPMHYLCERTDPELVKLCIDVYWVHIGGEEPAEFIRRYADRAAYFHLKDGRKGVFSELGRGEVDFNALWPEVQKVSPEWVVYEQDRTDIEPRESLRISREFLRERLSL
jgi:sugar phosphate isomerase/epimerase